MDFIRLNVTMRIPKMKTDLQKKEITYMNYFLTPKFMCHGREIPFPPVANETG